MKVTCKEFDEAVIHILGKDYNDFLNNKTSRINAIAHKIFLEGGNIARSYKDNQAISIVREAYRRLTKEGHFVWDEE